MQEVDPGPTAGADVVDAAPAVSGLPTRLVVLIVPGEDSTPTAEPSCSSIVEQLRGLDWGGIRPRIQIVPDADTGQRLLRELAASPDHLAEHQSAETRGDSKPVPREERRFDPTVTAGCVAASWPSVERRWRATDRRQCQVSRSTDADDRRATHGTPQAEGDRFSSEAVHCTDREQQIVQLLRQGLTNKQIAQQLDIMEDTVKKHLQHIYNKLGVRRRALVMLGRSGVWMATDQSPALR